MAEEKRKREKVQIVWRSGSKLLKILVIVLIVLSTAALAALWWVQHDVTRQTEKMREEAAAIEYENEKLEQKIEDLGSAQSIQDIAREELGMVSADTVLIHPQPQN